MIGVADVRVDAEMEAEVLAVLRSGQLAQGPTVGTFEKEIGSLTGAAHAVAVSSGTTALVAALSAHGIGPGDEVITSPFTFAATLNAILQVGATAVFADVDRDFVIEPAAVAAQVTPATAALLPVHLFGLPADLIGIQAIADRHGLAVIEDAAQALGASAAGHDIGAVGTCCFSFYATKSLTTGEGGMVTTSSEAIAEHVRILRNQGMAGRYDYVMPGRNYRMTDLQAALGIPQARRFREVVAARTANAAQLTAGLADVEGIRLPRGVVADRTHAWHQYTIAVTDAARLDRDALLAGLAERGINAAVFYPRPCYDYACYVDHERVVLSDLPAAVEASRTVLSLPVHQHLSRADIEQVIAAMRDALC